MGDDVKVRYRRVSCQVWGDEKVQKLDGYGQFLWVFLITHPTLQQFGAMRHTSQGLAHELAGLTQWPAKRFVKSYLHAVELGLIEHSPRHSFISIPQFLRHNPPGNPNTVKGWAPYVQLIPECDARDVHFARCKAFVEGMGKAFAKALPEAFLEACPQGSPQLSRNSDSDSELEVFQTSPSAQKKLSKPQADMARLFAAFTVKGIEPPNPGILGKHLKAYRSAHGDTGLDRMVDVLLAIQWPEDLRDVGALTAKILGSSLHQPPGGPRSRPRRVDRSAADETKATASLYG